MISNNYLYQAYGLKFKSSVSLPGRISKFEVPDVTIQFGKINSFTDEAYKEIDLNENIKLRIKDNIKCIFWYDKEICRIKNSNEIILNKSNGLKESFLRLILLGIAIPLLLSERDILVFHATAVNINGNAIAFLGPEGAGKSTTSFAFIKNGYNLISDDVLGVTLNNKNMPQVISGFPMIKLWPEVIVNMGENPVSMPKIQSNIEKRFYSVDTNFITGSVPLKMIFSIRESEINTSISDMPLQESTIELVKSTLHAVTFDYVQLSNNLKDCADIAKKVPIKSLEIKRSLDDLSDLVQIIADFVNK